MIRFIYGGGSDAARAELTKSIREVLAVGDQAMLLVPEQETVSVERRMLEALPPAAQLSFEVLNFSRLANRTFRSLGGLSHKAASPAVSALIMWQTVGELLPLFKHYKSNVKDSALCEMLLQTEAQCKACCITAEKLAEVAESLPEDSLLRLKLNDIAMAIATYELRLGERFDHTADELTRLARVLEKEGRRLYGNTHIFIDSFTDFTVQELKILEALLTVAPSVTVTFPLQHKRETGLHLEAVKRTHEQLIRMSHMAGKDPVQTELALKKPTRAHEYVSRHLFAMEAEKGGLGMRDAGDLTVTLCPTPFDEANAAAATIHRLVRGGCRYRDITVVTREAADWAGILDAALEKEGIPFYLSEKTDITLRPLIKLILGALRIYLGKWRAEDVVGYLKTGLCGVDPDDLNLFEEYANVWLPRGERSYTAPFYKNADGFVSAGSPRGKAILEGANRVREKIVPPLTAFFAAMEKSENATALCRALYDFLEALQIRDRLKRQAEAQLAAGEKREAEELARLYQVTVDALEAISDAFGDKKLTASAFADALKLVFARTDIGSIPTSADEVTVGSASMLRADRPRYVLVLGLNEGKFPRTVKENGLFSAAEKKRLEPFEVFFPDGEKLASDELFFLYRAFAAPREGLYLFYSALGTDGKALTPSIGITRVKVLFEDFPVQNLMEMPAVDRIFTPNGAMELLPELPPDTAHTVLDHLEAMDVPAARSLRRPVVETNAAVDSTTAQGLFAGGGRYNPTHLEKFSSCRFAYYCNKILHLREEPADSVSAAEVGNFIHHVLEHIMRTVQEDKLPFTSYNSSRQAAMVADICDKYQAALLEAGTELTPRSEALFDRLRALAELIVSNLFAEMSQSPFRPAFMELDLSAIGERTAITLEDGTAVDLSGKADRIDICRKPTGEAYLRVVDYKTGHKEFELKDIEKGFGMQMPLYLMALCKGKHEALAEKLSLPADTVFRPAGVSYFSSAVEKQVTPCRIEPAEALRQASSSFARSGMALNDPTLLSLAEQSQKTKKGGVSLVEEGDFARLFRSLESSVSRIAAAMQSGSATVEPVSRDGKTSPCNYCAFAPICRAAQKTTY